MTKDWDVNGQFFPATGNKIKSAPEAHSVEWTEEGKVRCGISFSAVESQPISTAGLVPAVLSHCYRMHLLSFRALLSSHGKSTTQHAIDCSHAFMQETGELKYQNSSSFAVLFKHSTSHDGITEKMHPSSEQESIRNSQIAQFHFLQHAV